MVEVTSFDDLPMVLTAMECAQVARCSVSSIYRAVEAGELRSTQSASGRGSRRMVRIARESFVAWLGVQPAAESVAS